MPKRKASVQKEKDARNNAKNKEDKPNLDKLDEEVKKSSSTQSRELSDTVNYIGKKTDNPM